MGIKLVEAENEGSRELNVLYMEKCFLIKLMIFDRILG